MNCLFIPFKPTRNYKSKFIIKFIFCVITISSTFLSKTKYSMSYKFMRNTSIANKFNSSSSCMKFSKYKKNFFPKEATGKKTTEYIAGYITAIKDILNLIEYEKKCY